MVEGELSRHGEEGLCGVVPPQPTANSNHKEDKLAGCKKMAAPQINSSQALQTRMHACMSSLKLAHLRLGVQATVSIFVVIHVEVVLPSCTTTCFPARCGHSHSQLSSGSEWTQFDNLLACQSGAFAQTRPGNLALSHCNVSRTRPHAPNKRSPGMQVRHASQCSPACCAAVRSHANTVYRPCRQFVDWVCYSGRRLVQLATVQKGAAARHWLEILGRRNVDCFARDTAR